MLLLMSTFKTTFKINRSGPAHKPPLHLRCSKVKSWNSKDKRQDYLMALDFIWCIDDLAKTNSWTDTVTYNNFPNAFRGVARRWLYSMVDMLDYADDQLIWSTFKPMFQAEFMVQSNDKLIMEGLSNLTTNPNEDTRDLINRITDIMVIRELCQLPQQGANPASWPKGRLAGWLQQAKDKTVTWTTTWYDAALLGSTPQWHQEHGRTKRSANDHSEANVQHHHHGAQREQCQEDLCHQKHKRTTWRTMRLWLSMLTELARSQTQNDAESIRTTRSKQQCQIWTRQQCEQE